MNVPTIADHSQTRGRLLIKELSLAKKIVEQKVEEEVRDIFGLEEVKAEEG